MTSPKVPPALLTPEIVFSLFEKWINQRPGLEPRNYYDPADLHLGRRSTYADGFRAYNSEVRSIGRDRKRALAALDAARSFPFNPDAMLDAFRAFSGRLQLVARRKHECPCGNVWDSPLNFPESTPNLSGESYFCPKCQQRPTSFPVFFALDYTTGQYWPTEYRPAAATVLETYNETVRPKQLPAPGQRFNSIADIESAADRAGSHFFSRGNKRFFRSRIVPGVYQGKNHVFFVTSEQSGDDRPRLFTVRVFNCEDASINSVGEFNSSTLTQARQLAKWAAEQDRTGKHTKPAEQGTKCPVCGHYRNSGCTGEEKQ